MLNNIEDKEEGNNLLAPMSIKKFFDQMDDESLQVLVYNNKLIVADTISKLFYRLGFPPVYLLQYCLELC